VRVARPAGVRAFDDWVPVHGRAAVLAGLAEGVNYREVNCLRDKQQQQQQSDWAAADSVSDSRLQA